MDWPRDFIGQVIQDDCFYVMEQIPPNSIDLIVTSPPYNVGMAYETVLPWPRYFGFLHDFIYLCKRCLRDGGVLAVNLPKEIKLRKEQINTLHRRVVRMASRFEFMCEEAGLLPRESIVWAKGSREGEPYSHISATGSDNNLYIRSTCEIITLHSKNRYFYDGGTGRRGREAVPFTDETKDVWWLRPKSSRKHPRPFPVEIPDRLIRMFTLTRKHRPIVLDPFAGIGTTGLAAKDLGRDYILIERYGDYCKVARNLIDRRRRR